MPWHTVAEGEWIGSIAADAGFDAWRWIWNLGQNANLRATRHEPNLLVPGDKVYVPAVEPKTESRSTDAEHVFTRKHDEDKLIIRFNGIAIYVENFGPIDYTLTVAGHSNSGTVSSEDDRIEVALPISTKEATLEIGGVTRTLTVGGLQPIERLAGMQSRLNNQGFLCGVVDNMDGSNTQQGATGFQEYYQLKVDGIIGPQTRGKTKEVYGC
jgi:N-acetylmuramoyl-L-alanine amidase